MREGDPHRIEGTVFTVTMLPTDVPEVDGVGAVMFVIKSGSRVKSKVVTSECGGGVAIRLIDDFSLKISKDIGRYADIWTYSDESEAIHFAMGQALKYLKRKRSRRATQKEVDEFVGGFADTLTLNRNEAAKFIKTANWRKRRQGGVEVKYEGKWRHLCRTDLKDDVRTWTSASSHGDCNRLDYYSKSVAYGARVTDDAFFIVDAFSDG